MTNSLNFSHSLLLSSTQHKSEMNRRHFCVQSNFVLRGVATSNIRPRPPCHQLHQKKKRTMGLLLFIPKCLLLVFTLWFAIWASRVTCCSTFTYVQHKELAVFSNEYWGLVKECMMRY